MDSEDDRILLSSFVRHGGGRRRYRRLCTEIRHHA